MCPELSLLTRFGPGVDDANNHTLAADHETLRRWQADLSKGETVLL